MTSTLEQNPVRALLARVLPEADLEGEYPLVFGPNPSGELVSVEVEGEVRAVCGILLRDFIIGPHRVRGGLIGSVSTDVEWRRRGLGSEVVRRAEERLREQGCLFSMLWSESPDFYLQRGYAPCGMENDYLLGSELVSALPRSESVREWRPSDTPYLVRLHATHSTRVARTADEMQELLEIPGMTTLVLERSCAPGQPPVPTAYACLGRGRDLPDSIHEWAGASEDVLPLLRAHLERRFPRREPGALFLMGPPASSDLPYRLTRLGAPSQRGILGLGKILNLEGSARLLEELLGVSGCGAVRVDGDAVVLGDDSTRCARLDRDLLLAVLFGAPDVRDDVRALLARMGYDQVPLPLLPFAWGLDSI